MSDGEKAFQIVNKMVRISDERFSSMVEDNVLTIFYHLPLNERKELLTMCIRTWSSRGYDRVCENYTPQCECKDTCEAPGFCSMNTGLLEHSKVEHTPESVNQGIELQEKKLTLSMVIGAGIVIVGTLVFVLNMFLSQPEHRVMEQVDRAKEVAEELLP